MLIGEAVLWARRRSGVDVQAIRSFEQLNGDFTWKLFSSRHRWWPISIRCWASAESWCPRGPGPKWYAKHQGRTENGALW